MSKALLTILIAALALSMGCASATAEAAGSGRLVIIGGSLGDNEQIYARMIAHAGDGGSVGIVPTASGDPQDSTEYYVEAFNSRAGRPMAEGVDLPRDEPENALDPAIAEQLASRDMLFFTGGDQSRITRNLLPDGQPTPAYEACWAVLAKGGAISGSSAGAAMMSDPMLRWGGSDEALLVGRSEVGDRGVGVGQGMGFFPYGLTGQHFLRRGRMGRMVAALEYSGLARGYGIADSRAIDVDLATGRIEVLGDRGVLLVDNGAAVKTGLERSNIRLSLLNDGDVVDGPTGEVTPSPGMQPIPGDIVGLTMLIEEEDAWGRDVFADLLEKLARQPATQAVAHDPNFELRLSRDDRTRFYERGGAVTAVNVRLDIVPKDGAEAAAAKALAEIASEE